MGTSYSKTPLFKKLGLKEGYKILLFNKPANYWKLFDFLPDHLEEVKEMKALSVDFIHMFFIGKDEVLNSIPIYKDYLKKDGSLWVSWPKASSKLQSELKRDWIRNFVLDQGLVDVKVASIDQDWSGLKFVYRLKDR